MYANGATKDVKQVLTTQVAVADTTKQVTATVGTTAVRHARRRGIGAVGFAVAALALTTIAPIDGVFTSNPVIAPPQQAAPSVNAPSLLQPAGPDAGVAQMARLAGVSQYSAAVAVSQRAFPNGAPVVYLANVSNPVDALPASILNDGPVLLVDTAGGINAEVLGEIARLKARKVVALGGPAAISDAVLGQASGSVGGQNARLAGDNRVQTAAAIASHAFPGGTTTVYVADAYGSNGKGSPDAVAGGALKDGPIITVGPAAGDKAIAKQVIAKLNASNVVALGGQAVLPDVTLNEIAAGRAVGRLAGADRYATAGQIASHAYPGGAGTIYIAEGNALADALVAGALNDGPLLLVPAGPSQATRDMIKNFGASNVVAVGTGVSDEAMRVAAGQVDLAAKKALEVAATQEAQQAATLNATLGQLVHSQAPSPSDFAKEQAVVNEINAQRQARGLKPLARDSRMDDAARMWAQTVALTGNFVHSNGAKAYSALMPAGWKKAGENMVGFYNVDPVKYAQGTAQLWINSPGHYANLADPVYTHTGVGVATGRDWVYCVQNFGRYF
ncbi:MAG: cell wall-binding repeat-containing protein [Actinomycetaceae bacterium]|nr:cell wall-binding repeat-containing protein [Actinomycetaceae bacterium]